MVKFVEASAISTDVGARLVNMSMECGMLIVFHEQTFDCIVLNSVPRLGTCSVIRIGVGWDGNILDHDRTSLVWNEHTITMSSHVTLYA